PQVEITAKLVDVDVSALREMGIRWGVRDLNIGSFTNPSTDVDPNTWVTPSPGALGKPSSNQIGVDAPSDSKVGTIGGILTRPWGTVEFPLDPLQQDRKAKHIPNPRITTEENHDAQL